MKQGLPGVAPLLRSDGLIFLGSHMPPWELVPQSLCLVLIWAGLEKRAAICLVEAVLLWLA